MLPKEPTMLLSVINTKLRDFYRDLDVFCEDSGENKQEIIDRLAAAGYHYDKEKNQFV